jgi:hypothetical protein
MARRTSRRRPRSTSPGPPRAWGQGWSFASVTAEASDRRREEFEEEPVDEPIQAAGQPPTPPRAA